MEAFSFGSKKQVSVLEGHSLEAGGCRLPGSALPLLSAKEDLVLKEAIPSPTAWKDSSQLKIVMMSLLLCGLCVSG